MLDKGFENDITAIISHTMQGSDRQTMMCAYHASLFVVVVLIVLPDDSDDS